MDKIDNIRSVCKLNGGNCDRCVVKDDCCMLRFRISLFVGETKPRDILHRDFQDLKERIYKRVDNHF